MNLIRREKGAGHDLPIVLVVEDNTLMQGIVEDALKEGGFETAIAHLLKKP